MNGISGFSTLPNELYNLIAEEIQGDTPTLIALTQVSKRFHEIFSSFLYRDVSDTALYALSLSKRSRLPLVGPHPASYVNKLSVSPTRHNLSVFRKQFVSAMKNIVLYASDDAIESFSFRSKSISFPEVLGGTTPVALKSIKEFILLCSIPTKNIRSNLSLTVSEHPCIVFT